VGWLGLEFKTLDEPSKTFGSIFSRRTLHAADQALEGTGTDNPYILVQKLF
jgi:hypothetical protein